MSTRPFVCMIGVLSRPDLRKQCRFGIVGEKFARGLAWLAVAAYGYHYI